MLIFVPANLAVFATPKTGTTAFYLATKKHAQIIFAGQPRFKHMTVRKYERHLQPFLAEAYNLKPERVATMREPIDYLRSWYKYRQRDDLLRADQSTQGKTFDEFALAAVSDDPPKFAAVGPQSEFLGTETGEIGIHHLFSYEDDLMARFVSVRLEKLIQTKEQNVSPKVPADLEPDMEKRVRQALSREYEVWQKIRDAGGYLETGYSG